MSTAVEKLGPENRRSSWFKPGQSGNPGGRPRGFAGYSVQKIVSDVLNGHKDVVHAAVLNAFTEASQTFKGLELAAKLNREIQGDAPVMLPAAAVQFNLVVQGAPASAPVLVEHPPLQFASLATNGHVNGSPR